MHLQEQQCCTPSIHHIATHLLNYASKSMTSSKIIKLLFLLLLISACSEAPAEEVGVVSARFDRNLLWLKVEFQSSLKDINIEGRNRVECETPSSLLWKKYSLIGYISNNGNSANFFTELHMMKNMQSTSKDDFNEIKYILEKSNTIDCGIFAVNYYGPPIKLGYFSVDVKSAMKQ